MHRSMEGVPGEVENDDGEESRRDRIEIDPAKQTEAARIEPREEHDERCVEEEVREEREKRERQVRPEMSALPRTQRDRGLDQRERAHHPEDRCDRRDIREEVHGARTRERDERVREMSGTSPSVAAAPKEGGAVVVDADGNPRFRLSIPHAERPRSRRQARSD